MKKDEEEQEEEEKVVEERNEDKRQKVGKEEVAERNVQDVLPHPASMLIWQPTILCTVENTSCQASATVYSMHINKGRVPNCIL